MPTHRSFGAFAVRIEDLGDKVVIEGEKLKRQTALAAHAAVVVATARKELGSGPRARVPSA